MSSSGYFLSLEQQLSWNQVAASGAVHSTFAHRWISQLSPTLLYRIDYVD